MCTYSTRIFKLLFELVWVLNANTQSDESVVNLKSLVVNYVRENGQETVDS